MKRFFILLFSFFVAISGFSQGSPLKLINFHKVPSDIVDLVELKNKAGRDCDFDSNKAALIRVKAQGFNEKTMLDFSVFPKPGIEIIYKEFRDGEMWLYVSSKCMGTIVFKYMGEFEFSLPNKLEPKAGYELTLGMETATLVIRTVPVEAEIYVDNNLAGRGEAICSVSIGAEHRYRVVCENYYSVEDVVRFDKSERKELNVELNPNFGYIIVKTDPSGADVYIDEQKVGVTPYQMKKVSPGNHSIELRKSGYDSYADMVTIKKGEVNKQFDNVKLTAMVIPMGSLDIISVPDGAILTINGRQYGQTPQALGEVEVGTYTINFKKEGYGEITQVVDVKEGKKETVKVTLTKAGNTQPTAAATPASTTTPTEAVSNKPANKPASANASSNKLFSSVPTYFTSTNKAGSNMQVQVQDAFNKQKQAQQYIDMAEAYKAKGEKKNADSNMAKARECLKNAKKSIDESIGESTVSYAKMWHYCVVIYYKIMAYPELNSLDPNAAAKAAEAIRKLKSNDSEYYNKHASELTAYATGIDNAAYQKGIDDYNSGSYSAAAHDFLMACYASDAVGKYDDQATYNLALSATKCNNYDLAADAYRVVVDNGNADQSVMNEMINAHISSGRKSEIVHYVEKVVHDNPDVLIYCFILGTIYGEKGPAYNLEKAIECYDKVIGMDKNYMDAYYNAGAVLIDKAADVYEQANNVDPSSYHNFNAYMEATDAMTAEAKKYDQRALPYLEKCYETNPNDAAVVRVLNGIYTRLKMDKKAY